MQETVGEQTLRYSVTELTREDIPALVEFYNENDALEGTTETTSAGEFESWLDNPMNTMICLLAFAEKGDGGRGKLVATVDYHMRPGDDKAWGWMHVHPDYRLKGVGRDLYARFEKWAIGANAASLHVTPSDKATLLLDFLRRRGYELDRYFWEMQLPADKEVPGAEIPEGITLRTFVPGQDEQLLTHVRNVTFADHYGSVPRTLEEMTHLTRQPEFRPGAVFFAFEGDTIAGFCFNRIDPREEERRGVAVGHVNTLGVVPEYRGRGIGRTLLLASINYLRRHATLVELGVEGKNASALGLYESVGFHRHKGWANMMKKLG